MTFNIIWDKEGVYVKFRGVVTAQDLIDANNYVLSNANFDSICYQIFDFLDIDDFNISSYDIEIIAMMDKSQSEIKKEMKIAIVTKNNYIKEITSEYDQYMTGSDWETKIFDSIEIAKIWVNS
ncbi:MAG: hypothetical protein PF485_05865 [Bacteroidales bacterium]|jgi:hypothetical protein|nr:hypothetical protein [Bacteroidales bacterium]